MGSTIDAFGRRNADTCWGDMRIIRAFESKNSKGLKYSQNFTATRSIWTLLPMRSKYHEMILLIKSSISRGIKYIENNHDPESTVVRLVCNGVRYTVSLENTTSHNYTNSTFHNLPVEIILELTDYLSPVSILAMKRVCSKFRTCLTGIGPAIESDSLWMSERYHLIFLLRLDRLLQLQQEYNQRCERTIFNWLLEHRGCSGCLETHNSRHFSARQFQLASSPKSRICVGLEGFVELCEHFSWSAECLGRGVRVVKELELRCSFTHDVDIYGNTIAGFSVGMNPVLRYSESTDIVIERTFPLFTINVDGVTTQEMLCAALRTINGDICPHLRTSSPNLFDRPMMTTEYYEIRQTADPSSNSFFRSCGRLVKDSCVIWAECPSPNCLTSYGLRRVDLPRWQYPGHLIVLDVSREMLGGPLDPSWRAQVVRGSNAEDDDAVEIDSRQKTKPEDCDAKLWACRGLFCASKYKGRIFK